MPSKPAKDDIFDHLKFNKCLIISGEYGKQFDPAQLPPQMAWLYEIASDRFEAALAQAQPRIGEGRLPVDIS